MSKICGKSADFSLVKQERSRTIIGYELNVIEGSELYEWYEVYFYRRIVGLPTIEMLRLAIENDINSQTDERILSGFIWEGKPVWLSSENQFNYKAAYDLALQTHGASLPIKFKLGEDSDGNPIYHTFEELAEFTDFYTKTIAYVNQCLNEGWARKDSIDWKEYEDALKELEPK